MKAWIRSSLVSGWPRRTLKGSVVVRGTATAARLFMFDSAALSGVPKSSVVMRPWTQRNVGGIDAIANRSTILRAIDRLFGMGTLAWQESATRGWLRASLDLPSALDAPRMRLVGWLIFSAAMTRIVLTGIDALAGQSMAGLGWVVAVPLALACIFRPEAVIAAWHTRLFLRRLSTATHPE